MPVEYREGDLFALDDVDCIGHGVNTKGVMGAGIAALFRRKFPGLYLQYVLWCDTHVLTPGGCMPWEDATTGTFVFNIASQNEPGPDATVEWLSEGLNKAVQQAQAIGRGKLAIPRIAAGIGGLTWEQVQETFNVVGAAHDTFTLVVVSLPGADS